MFWFVEKQRTFLIGVRVIHPVIEDTLPKDSIYESSATICFDFVVDVFVAQWERVFLLHIECSLVPSILLNIGHVSTTFIRSSLNDILLFTPWLQ